VLFILFTDVMFYLESEGITDYSVKQKERQIEWILTNYKVPDAVLDSFKNFIYGEKKEI
jgi:hypothetical protein